MPWCCSACWAGSPRTAASWNSQPTSFTVNLSIATLEDERFAQKIAAALNSHGIAAETLGFEIAEALCTQRRAQVERFITACGKVGSWVVIDDFSFDSQVLPLLRSKALRLVKIDAKLTSSALKDKLSQAMVVATVQAAKVLGIHCAAKRVDSQAPLQWLTAIGCDFAQGQALAGPRRSTRWPVRRIPPGSRRWHCLPDFPLGITDLGAAARRAVPRHDLRRSERAARRRGPPRPGRMA